MPAPAPDVIKMMVLQAVAHHLVSEKNGPPALPEAPENVTGTSSYALKPGLIKLHVYTTDQGTRQFTIRISEDKLVPRDTQ
jgi:hypothetical protein